MKPPIAHRSPVLTGQEMRETDRKAISDYGIPGSILMEAAGSGAAGYIIPSLKPESEIQIVCGKGNNGGDGFVLARHLAQAGHKITLWPAVDGVFTDKSGDEGRDTQFRMLQKTAANTDSGIRLSQDRFETLDRAGNIIIDAVFGTGVKRTIEGPAADTLEKMNDSTGRKIALDIPSGLDADNGLMHGPVFKADETITFGAWKTGLFAGDAYYCTGKVTLIEIGLPRSIVTEAGRYVIFPADENPVPERNARHKYDGAVVNVIGGSGGLCGAAIMAARAAWKTGIGAVVSICTAGLTGVFEKNLIEAVKKPIGRLEATFFTPQHTAQVLETTQHYGGVVLIGPGLGRIPETIEFVKDFLMKNTLPVVMDADALVVLGDKSFLKSLPGASEMIITPHPGELRNITGKDTSLFTDRLQASKNLSDKFPGLILSKGQPTFLMQKGEDTQLAGYNSTVFTRAGFGDVLAGKIAGFRALKASPLDSCLFGIFDGKYKSDKFIRSSMRDPEPLDIL